MLEVITANLASPAVLCFVLGAFAVAVRSNLALPEPLFIGLSIYLILSIGCAAVVSWVPGIWAQSARRC